MLVIDDNSPDGTGEIADRLADELDSWVLHRARKEGIGRAYLAGFEQLSRGDAHLILEMDCDFSHDPADVPRLIAAVRGRRRSRARFALRAGRRHANWGLVRRVISWGGSFYARVLLGVPSAT